MQMNVKKSIGLCLACGVLLSGCTEHLERTDTINSFAGDSVARNISIHTIDPTPYRSRYRHIHHNGQRMIKGMKNYENPPKPPKKKVAGTGIGKL